jgi:uncharacterized protein (TIGR02284 family)
MASNEEVISTLNELVETCRDAQEGFRTAAEGVRDGALKELFLSSSRQRASFVGELRDEVRRLGGEPEDEGSVAGSLHRGWMEIESAATGGDESSIIGECVRGESAAVSKYVAALGIDMPANTRSIVERQFAEFRQSRDRLNSLGRSGGAGA